MISPTQIKMIQNVLEESEQFVQSQEAPNAKPGVLVCVDIPGQKLLAVQILPNKSFIEITVD